MASSQILSSPPNFKTMCTKSNKSEPLPNEELSNYFRFVKQICESLTDNPEDYEEGPFSDFYKLHIDRNQQEQGHTYAPLLVSKKFDRLYTNTGILHFKNKNKNKNKIDEQELIKTLDLKEYNNVYYYVDMKNSYNTLEQYYSEKEVKEQWKYIFEN